MAAADLLAALMLLTRLPVTWLAPPHDPATLARCIWAFPIVGLVIGALGSLTYAAAHSLGLPPSLAAAWTIGALTLLTGALHEDGLADTMDGFGGGATLERKLKIMRDSRIGSYGAIALVVSLAVRITALTALADPWTVTKGLTLAATLGRTGLLVPMLVLDPARADGLASALHSRTHVPAAVAFGLSAAICLLCLTPVQSAAIIALTTVICLGWAHLTRSQIGGYTGDVLGACETIIECAILTALVTMMK